MTDFPQLPAFRGGGGIIHVIGHRGARDIMPENTIEGFEFTLNVGVQVLEFDVVLTSDRVPVITHNHHLSVAATRTKNGCWLEGPEPAVSSMTFKELQQFDVGGLDGRTVYGQRFRDQAFMNRVQIPRLTALFDLICKPEHKSVSLLLELKSDPSIKENAPERTRMVAAIIDEIRSYSLQDRTVLHSFDWDLLRECRHQAPEMPTSYLSQANTHETDLHEDSPKSVAPDLERMSGSLPQSVARAGGQFWCPYYLDVTADTVAEAHTLGLIVAVWTVNQREDIIDMINLGVDGIVTDNPGRVQRCLLERGLHWIER